MERRLQLLALGAFILLCTVGSAVGVRTLLTGPTTVVRVGTPPVQPSPRVRPEYEAGERIAIAGVDFSQDERTVVLVVRKGCRFCDESMPFYKRLGDDGRVAGRARIVMVAPDEEAVSREELLRHGIRVDQVLQVGLGQLKVRGTPTAVVVNRAGIVERVLVGRLDAAQETALIEALAGPRP